VSGRASRRVLRCCVRCGRTGSHNGRGLCESCYDYEEWHGNLLAWPRLTRTADEVVADWRVLGAQRATEDVARRIGMGLPALRRALARARARGLLT